MFRALLVQSQKVLHKRKLVCSETATVPQPTDIIRKQYTNFRFCVAPPEDKQVKLQRPLILNKVNEK
jgi:hypothetical protein